MIQSSLMVGNFQTKLEWDHQNPPAGSIETILKDYQVSIILKLQSPIKRRSIFHVIWY